MLGDIVLAKKTFEEACKNKTNFNEMKGQKITNPFYRMYDEVETLSYKILNRCGFDLSLDKEEFNSLLFDVSLLFEQYLRKLLKNSGFNIPDKKGRYGNLEISRGVKKYKLYPDIIIEKKGKAVILDAKYKNFDFFNGVNSEDLFQIMTYTLAFSKVFNITGCGFIYPVNDSDLNNDNKMFKDEMC